MRFVITICLGGVLFIAAGCASTKTFVLLRHPVTHKVVECPGETGVDTGSAAEMKSCVEPYTKDGFEIIYSY
jgi:hypothetical protein